MKLLSTCLLLVGLATSALAQSTLKGIIRDGAGKPLPFASIALLSAHDLSLVKGGISSETGIYELDNIRPGQYKLMASAVGYAPYAYRVKIFSGRNGSEPRSVTLARDTIFCLAFQVTVGLFAYPTPATSVARP